ncbi:MAG: TolC family protein, partial [Muribaculaceae bacterium]|nr:TolC family protein [Muribaculaceae bacterium]
ARGDSLRLALGDISETDAVQSALDARVARAEMLAAESDYFAACMAMNTFAGVRGTDTVCTPADFPAQVRHRFRLGALVAAATEGRADIVAALKNADVARKALAVEKKERNLDFDLALGYNYNTEVRNEIAPAPRFSGVSVGVTIPLKFSNSNKGAVNAARIRARQAEMQYDAACAEIGHEVAAALYAYDAAVDALEGYSANTLAESDEILARYSDLYSRGDVSLIEFKEMRQAQTDLRQAYIDALFNCAVATAALNHATGNAAE